MHRCNVDGNAGSEQWSQHCSMTYPDGTTATVVQHSNGSCQYQTAVVDH
ncbi:hypothetical protein ACT42I_09805 [Acinetobacter baumannii]